MSDLSSEESDQPRFLLRVYLVLFIQCLIFCGLCFLFNAVDPVKSFIKRLWWFPIIFLCLFALVVILVLFVPAVNQTYPVNLFFLLLLGIFGGLGASLDCSQVEFKVVLAAVALSFGVLVLVTLIVFVLRVGIRKCCVYLLFATFLAAILMMAFALTMHILKMTMAENIFLILALAMMTFVFIFMSYFVVRLFSTNINNWSSSNLLLFLWFPAFFALALFTFTNYLHNK